MPRATPDFLRALLDLGNEADLERAWGAFLEGYSELLLRVARSLGGDHDAVMDRYAFTLQSLRRNNCQRLRSYLSDGRGRFDTWLIVVARRLCLDYLRHRYGRSQSSTIDARERHAERRNLNDLIGDELGLAALPARPDEAPDLQLQRGDLHSALAVGLAQLDPSDRLLLRLRFEDDLSVPEIARLQGERSPFTLYRRLDKLLSTLRRSLQNAGIRESAP